MGTRYFSRRRGLRFLIAVLMVLIGRSAQAQLDTPAARQARAALAAVQNTYQTHRDWSEWAAELNLVDVQYELWAGERGRPRVLQECAARLRAARLARFADTAFVRLANALETRAREMHEIPLAEWPNACQTAAETYEPVTTEVVASARAACRERLATFAAYYFPIRSSGDAWHKFLYWNELSQLTANVPGATPEPAALDRIEVRWSAAPAVWHHDLLFEASLAVRNFIRLLRAETVGETATQHAAAWMELAELLAARSSGPAPAAPIAAAIRRRESLGQASPLTASVRRELSRPNLLLAFDSQWLTRQLRQPIDDEYDVDGVFAGTRSRGRGRMTGEMSARILPSTAVGRWELLLNGTSTARTRGSRDRVTVVSRATTKVAATKPFRLDSLGLTPERAKAGAMTSIVFESIDSPGLPRRRSQAIRETNARRPQAERESAAYARSSILEQINTQAATLAGDFNRAYHKEFRDPRIGTGHPAPQFRVVSDEQRLRWECLLEGTQSFGASSEPSPYDCGSPVIVSLAPSAIEEQAVVRLGGRQLTGVELGQQLGQRPVDGQRESKRKDEGQFSVTFAARPCEVDFVDGLIRLRLFVEKFDSEDVNYPEMTVDVAYRPEPRAGQLVLLREGRVKVTPRATAEGSAKLSGRQQTLRLGVERRLSKVLAPELEGGPLKLPISESTDQSLRMEHVRLAEGWLQIGLTTEPPAGS